MFLCHSGAVSHSLHFCILFFQHTLLTGRSKSYANTKFLVLNEDLTQVKGAKNATWFARALLAAVFTEEALLKCSLAGGEYRAAGRGNFSRKPPLDKEVVEAIIGKYILMCEFKVAMNHFCCFQIWPVVQLACLKNAI